MEGGPARWRKVSDAVAGFLRADGKLAPIYAKQYLEIAKLTGASTATISRVNRMLNGGTGMLEKSFRRLEESEEKPESEKIDN